MRYLSSRIVAVGYRVAESLGGDKLRIIPNGIPEPEPVSAEVRNKVRRELAGDSLAAIIIAVGRFAAPKGYEDLVDAFALLHRKDRRPVLVMVGEGRLLQSIRGRVESLGLQACVRMLGHREDVAQLLAASDLFASASHREGLPIAVLEGMMAGLPVVATDVGDMSRLVTEETGRIVPTHRPDLLAQALGELLAAPEMLHAMGQAAHRRAVLEYSVDLCVDRHIALYREVIDSHRRGRWTWQPSA
jgi:glycosyltransferase involved in cell wall biosynthesis